MNRIYGMALAMGCLILLSCNHESKVEALNKTGSEQQKPEDILFAVDSTAAPAPDQGIVENTKNAPSQKRQEVPVIDWSKKIIKTATVSIEIKDHAAFSGKIRELMQKQGGYIARENQQQTDFKIETTVTLKVPVTLFDETVDLLNKDVIRTTEKRISSDDVTAEFVDTRSRLEARKLVRQRYLELLKEAHKMSDILEVEQEINSIQEEIEAAAGRMNYLSQMAAMSTIELTYYQVINAAAADESQPGFGTEMVNALRSGTQAVGSLLIFVVSLWPFLTGGALVIWFLRRKMKKGNAVTA